MIILFTFAKQLHLHISFPQPLLQNVKEGKSPERRAKGVFFLLLQIWSYLNAFTLSHIIPLANSRTLGKWDKRQTSFGRVSGTLA